MFTINDNVFTINYNLTARSIRQSEGMGVISHKKCKNMLKKGKIFEKLDKNYRREPNYANFFKKGWEASIVTLGPEQISSNYKNNDENKEYFLTFDEPAAPFFGEKESIISVKNKIQFAFNLFVDTIKKQKKAVRLCFRTKN